MPDRVHVSIHSRASLLASVIRRDATAATTKPAATRRHPEENPVCVKVANPAAVRQHVVAGTQRDNMFRMAYTGRGGGRPVVRRDGLRARWARSVALHEAVRHGWDSDAVSAALLGSTEPTLW